MSSLSTVSQHPENQRVLNAVLELSKKIQHNLWKYSLFYSEDDTRGMLFSFSETLMQTISELLNFILAHLDG